MTFSPAKQGSSEPFGKATSAHYTVLQQYVDYGGEEYDLALVKLGSQMGTTTGFFA